MDKLSVNDDEVVCGWDRAGAVCIRRYKRYDWVCGSLSPKSMVPIVLNNRNVEIYISATSCCINILYLLMAHTEDWYSPMVEIQ